MGAQPEPRYVLKILFDSDQIDEEMLKAKAEGLLREYLPDGIDMKVHLATGHHAMLHICGALETVDAPHHAICEQLITASSLRFVRLADEATGETRRQVYPLLARTEQRLKRFVHNHPERVPAQDLAAQTRLPSVDPSDYTTIPHRVHPVHGVHRLVASA